MFVNDTGMYRYTVVELICKRWFSFVTKTLCMVWFVVGEVLNIRDAGNTATTETSVSGAITSPTEW